MDADIIYSSNKTHPLNHTFFAPKGEIKATLLILHGMSEHSGRYTYFANFLASQGIAVLTYDHLGHGKTAKSSAELGYFDSNFPYQALLKDTIIMANALKSRHPCVPHFIMGHSMGSFIVRNVLRHHSHDFTGAILMGTSDKDFSVNVFLPMFSILNQLAPHKVSNWGASITHKILNSKINDKSNPSIYAWLSENVESIRKYEADDMCGFNFTNNGYYTLAKLMQAGLNKPWYKNIAPDFPIMIVSGQNDPVGGMGKGIENLVINLKNLGFSQINKTLYPNMRHEPLHETNNQLVFKDIANWIMTRSCSK